MNTEFTKNEVAWLVEISVEGRPAWLHKDASLGDHFTFDANLAKKFDCEEDAIGCSEGTGRATEHVFMSEDKVVDLLLVALQGV